MQVVATNWTNIASETGISAKFYGLMAKMYRKISRLSECFIFFSTRETLFYAICKFLFLPEVPGHVPTRDQKRASYCIPLKTPRMSESSALLGTSWGVSVVKAAEGHQDEVGPAWRQQTHQPWKTGNQQRWEHSGARVWPGSYFLEGFVSWAAGLHVLVNSSKFCNLGLGGASSEGQNSNLGKVVRLWIFTCSFLSRFILLF